MGISGVSSDMSQIALSSVESTAAQVDSDMTSIASDTSVDLSFMGIGGNIDLQA